MNVFYDIPEQMKSDIERALEAYLDFSGFVVADFEQAVKSLQGEARCHARNRGDVEKTPREKDGLKRAVNAQLDMLDNALGGLSQTGRSALKRGLSVVAFEDFPLSPDSKHEWTCHEVIESSVDTLRRAVGKALAFETISTANEYNNQLIEGLIREYQVYILPANPTATLTVSATSNLCNFIEEMAMVMDENFIDGVPDLLTKVRTSSSYKVASLDVK